MPMYEYYLCHGELFGRLYFVARYFCATAKPRSVCRKKRLNLHTSSTLESHKWEKLVLGEVGMVRVDILF